MSVQGRRRDSLKPQPWARQVDEEGSFDRYSCFSRVHAKFLGMYRSDQTHYQVSVSARPAWGMSRALKCAAAISCSCVPSTAAVVGGSLSRAALHELRRAFRPHVPRTVHLCVTHTCRPSGACPLPPQALVSQFCCARQGYRGTPAPGYPNPGRGPAGTSPVTPT